MKKDDQAFINEMVKGLDESIRDLAELERGLVDRLGDERVAELREYWLKQMQPEDEEAFKLSLDHNDKMLIWYWSRLKRAHQSRAQAGKALMKDDTR